MGNIEYNFPSTEYDLYMSPNKHAINNAQYALREGDMIIAFLSYGKVGSTAVCRSIDHLKNASDRPVPVYHLHCLDKDLPPHEDVTEILPHRLSGSALRHVFDEHRDRFQWRFINGVREPISMLVSGYFENRFAIDGAPDVDDIRQYTKRFVNWMQRHSDKEYGRNVGVDLYSVPFDHAAGYTIIRQDNIHVLTYRVDRLSEIFSHAMSELLGKSGLTLKNFNKSSEKDIVVGGDGYAESYERMRETFTLPAQILDTILAHHSVTHFFKQDEIAGFRNRWID